MTKTTLDKTTIGFGLSAVVMSIVNTLLVVFKELMPPFKKAMADAMGHHWITHGVIALGLFLLMGFMIAFMVKPGSWSAGKLGNSILWSVITGVVFLAVFYMLH